MLKLKAGADILAEAGGVRTLGEAKKIFQEKLDADTLAKLSKIKTEDALLRIANAIAFCLPDTVFITTSKVRSGNGRWGS